MALAVKLRCSSETLTAGTSQEDLKGKRREPQTEDRAANEEKQEVMQKKKGKEEKSEPWFNGELFGCFVTFTRRVSLSLTTQESPNLQLLTC